MKNKMIYDNESNYLIDYWGDNDIIKGDNE